MGKAIIRHASIENCVRQLSRHATPRRFTHLCLSGANGRRFYNHVDTSVAGVFVFGLEDFSALPALFRADGGGPMHEYMGLTSTDQVAPADFAAQQVIELYILGHVQRFVNGRDRQGRRFVGLQIDDATFIDSIDQDYVPYRSDTMSWGDVDARYKLPGGGPLIDTDDVQDTALITPPTEE